MSDACNAGERCITCADEAVAMRVLEAGETAAVCLDEQGDRHEVAVELIAPVRPGQRVLVHAGVAIA
jgi:hydrogenase expression/formation protein HypC